MKIFISYGHNDHIKLVNLLFDKLIEAGHSPWKDDRYEGFSGIPAGEDFTKVIEKAIDESDFVVAFVTAATLQKPYCCDERQYAYNKKGNHYIQIRMDKAISLLGSAMSYIDMSDAEDSTGEINTSIFDEKLKALFAAFRDPESFHSNADLYRAKFDTHLKVTGALKYHEFISIPRQDDFVGREWLREKCIAWVQDSTDPCRLIVILGEAGTGKTAFVRHLCADKDLVRSVHVCVYDRPSTRNIKDTLKDLAYILSLNNQSYYDFLKDKDFEELKTLTPDGLFEFLFSEPLKNETEKYLLVIDGLDELDEATGLDPLMQILRQYACRLNPNISFLITGRPDQNIRTYLSTIPTDKPLNQVYLDKEQNHDDLKAYIEKKLREADIYSPALAEKILIACDGNFEYLSLLFRDISEGLEISESIPLPKGLHSRYIQYLQRRMKAFSPLQHTLISLLCTAYEPLPLSLLEELTNEDEDDILRELKAFGSLINRKTTAEGEILLSLFTKGFCDFLLKRVHEEFYANPKKATKLMAQFVLKTCKTETDFRKFPYIDRNGLSHLLKYAGKDPEAVCTCITDLHSKDEEATCVRLAAALCFGEDEIIRAYCTLFMNSDISATSNLKQNREINTLLKIAAAYKESGAHTKHLILYGDILKMNPTPDSLREAEEHSLKALSICEEEYALNPCCSTRLALIDSYDRLCSLKSSSSFTANSDEAKKLRHKMLELCEENYRETPSYITRGYLAGVYAAVGMARNDSDNPCDIAEARALLTKAFEYFEQNYKEKPCYQSRSDLASSYQMLGMTTIHLKELAKAEALLRKAIELFEQNYRERPCYQSRHSLAGAYSTLTVLLVNKDTEDKLKEGKKSALKDLALREENYRDNPCYQSRRFLAVSCYTLGNIAYQQNSSESAEAEYWFKESAKLLEENNRINPHPDDKNILKTVYENLIVIFSSKKTVKAMVEAQVWIEKYRRLTENTQDNQ